MTNRSTFWQKLNPRNWLELSSPVTLGFLGLSLLALLLHALTGGASNRLLFSVYRFAPGDILGYLRLFTHVLGHADFAHLAANMTMFLVLSPLVEQHFGAKRYVLLIAITALVTGLLHLLLSPATMGLGASGVVFMLIMLSAASGSRKGKMPLSLLLVAILFLGQELAGLIAQNDNVSQLAHIAGGLCGMAFGLIFRKNKAG